MNGKKLKCPRTRKEIHHRNWYSEKNEPKKNQFFHLSRHLLPTRTFDLVHRGNLFYLFWQYKLSYISLAAIFKYLNVSTTC